MTTHDAMMLPVALDLAAAPALLEAIRSALRTTPMLRLDASQVETLTLPCAQILVSAARTHAHVSIDNPSPAFAEAFAEFGLDLAACHRAPVEAPPQAPAAAPPESAPERSGPKRIMTIDDSKTMRDMLMFTLADAGYEVLQGVDGQNGLDVLGDTPVDVVITDINMPIMDGYDVIRNLRKNPVHARTPILVLTTEADAEKRALAREAGATGWMVKPFDPEKLLATVRKVSP
jgi:two-component system chemotaxis response regulator CheY